MNKFIFKIKELECGVCMNKAHYIVIGTSMFGGYIESLCKECALLKYNKKRELIKYAKKRCRS